MKLNELLSEKRSAVLNRWYEAILNTYPPDTAKFLKGQKNPFLNPVGSTTFKSMEILFDYLTKNEGNDKVSRSLDDIVRIRAVQEFTPSQCLRFIFFLKEAVREELKSELTDGRLLHEQHIFELKVDELSLLAFDIYMQCREKINDLKVRELQRWTFRRLQKADEAYKQECTYEDIHNETIDFQKREVPK